jgi:hypothetical protein
MQKVFKLSFPAFLLIILIGLGSCNKDEVETVPLGSVNINMYELSPYYNHEFGLQVSTDLDTYPVYYEIRSNAKVEGTTITINLLDIEKISYSGATIPDGALSTYVPVGVLSGVEYDITINVADRINTGKLKINSSFYTLTFDNTDGLTVNHDTLRRVPDYALWGYIAYADSTDEVLAQTFLDTLAAIGTLPLNVAPGYYFYFEYGQDSVYTQPLNPSYAYATEFFLSYAQSVTDIENIVNTYFNDPAYKKLHITIYWFYPGATKSAIIKPRSFDEMTQIHQRFE